MKDTNQIFKMKKIKFILLALSLSIFFLTICPINSEAKKIKLKGEVFKLAGGGTWTVTGWIDVNILTGEVNGYDVVITGSNGQKWHLLGLIAYNPDNGTCYGQLENGDEVILELENE